ncbi:MAG: ABC transporter ATP-binding protein [Candidatus Dormibacteria bacterium]
MSTPEPSSESMPILAIDHVVKEFPLGTSFMGTSKRIVHAVSDVSLTLRRQETFGLVGESGCGKTTLGRLIVGLEQLTSGHILIEGVDMSRLRGKRLKAMRREVQMMFQDPYASLDPRMRVGNIVREPLAIHHMGTAKEQRQHVKDLLHDVGLSEDAMDRLPYEFSGGQRQRIGLARALALHPKLIVADEPVSALDVSIRSHVLNLMNDLQKKYGLTYVIISHDLSVVRYISDRIGVMYLGKLVEIAPSREIYASPAHPYTKGLLGAIPIPDPEIERSKTSVPITGEIPSAINPPSGCRFRTRCPIAQDICSQQEPELREVNTEHVVACHFPLESTDKATTKTS